LKFAAIKQHEKLISLFHQSALRSAALVELVKPKALAGRFLCFSLMKSTKNQGLRKKKLKIYLSG
jgi:hypothetical protein